VFSVGDRVADYEIVARLKTGGMATLFLGRRTGAAGFAKHVAIKVIHPHLASDQTFVRMFVDEALLSARIHHPNVVHVEELRELDGQHFLVMEYVHACSLSQLLGELGERRRRLAPELAVHIGVTIADGLHAAHEVRDLEGELCGVVHRDVSPQNILLAYQGHVKLIDFGVAKARGRVMQTTGGTLKGKISYMSPEQATGRPVDRRSDVYALGLVLWEMLTMRKRFRARDDFGLLEQVRRPEPVPPSRHCGELSQALDAVVLRATAPDPDARYQTALDLRRALTAALPAATTLDSTHLAELLSEVMANEIVRERENLPESLSGVVGRARPEGESIVLTLTRTVDDVSLELIEDTDPSGPPGDPDVPQSGPRPVRRPPVPAPPAAPRERSVPLRGPSPAMMWAAIGLAVFGVIGLAVGGIVIATIGLGGDGAATPAATLPAAAAPAPAPAPVVVAPPDPGPAAAPDDPPSTPPPPDDLPRTDAPAPGEATEARPPAARPRDEPASPRPPRPRPPHDPPAKRPPGDHLPIAEDFGL
jgi:serine/threonine-protein kinase